ncbi:ABC transporter permease [Arcanobacterium hippocoleae]|uniref:Simple sugar transport system permease protein n=1 Tax=Arcanobacterium hippocoleae TaxID=149017 RepID=A0ABU1T1B0_9ACTO|nr:ABC transporter permease [Arcanobacterium hippocoleae]MDR6938640.1 simple sugar transport system permease protein [Arcanobacterium hippocoleae]
MSVKTEVKMQNAAGSSALRKISWKLPITFTFAAFLLAFFAVRSVGETLIRLNDTKQNFRIPDFTIPASTVLWIFFAIVLIVTAYSYFSAVARGKFGALERHLDTTGAIIVGLLTVVGFMIFAGAGSAGAVTITSTLVSTIAISTPLIFGSLSGVVCEHVGVVNIAIEGQLLVGAFAGVMAASFFHNVFAGLVMAPIVGALLGVLLALFAVNYGVDQIIVGVVLNVLALGLTTFFAGTIMSHNAQLFNTNRYALQTLPIPGLSQIPVIGPALFNQTILVYIMYVTVVVLTIFLYRSRWGLRMRACGEHPRAADTVGINVNRTRFLNTILGSAIAGLGGAFFTIGSGLIFTDNMAAGNGYIALAAMILGKWHPIGAVAASLMFGFAKALALLVPSLTTAIPSQLVNMIPYLVTIVAVAGFVGKSRPPAAENIPYLK